VALTLYVALVARVPSPRRPSHTTDRSPAPYVTLAKVRTGAPSHRTSIATAARRVRVNPIEVVSLIPSPFGERVAGAQVRNPSVLSTTTVVTCDERFPAASLSSRRSKTRPSGTGSSAPDDEMRPSQGIAREPAATERQPTMSRKTSPPASTTRARAAHASAVVNRRRHESAYPSPFGLNTPGTTRTSVATGATVSTLTVAVAARASTPETPARPTILYAPSGTTAPSSSRQSHLTSTSRPLPGTVRTATPASSMTSTLQSAGAEMRKRTRVLSPTPSALGLRAAVPTSYS